MAKDFSQLADDLEKEFKKIIDKELLQKFADKMRDIIVKRTKVGKGLTSDSEFLGRAGIKKLDKVSAEYAKWRKGKITGEPAPSGRKSNLTFTGQMLASIIAKVEGEFASVEVPQSTRADGKSTNKQVADWVTKNGRPFFNLSVDELEQLESFVEREIRKRVREKNRR